MSTCGKYWLLLPLWLLAQNASAITTFNYHWTDVTCGIVERDGSRTFLPCPSSDAPTFTASVLDGQLVFVTATFSYTYHDDGLGLSMPEYLPDGSINRIIVNEEAAGIYFRRLPCIGNRGCTTSAALDSFTVPSQLILGINGKPDDVEGQLSFSALSGSRFFPQQIPETPAISRTVFFDVGQVITISPAPEPATYALMLAGLVAVSAAARRRRNRG
jgi:PEP-CTERM motif